ncbi:hypothetical protein [Dyadobacter bucti]|uniref:hypothetical protein n=1 Tax=Dyadobacter bucti TaxID=2572203 RepID=UPI001108F6E2|nr:hypothetical protein [Dyadobacter bucti]
MRYIKDIPNENFKIGLYHWNNKYIIKIESGMYEQTYKIDDYELQNQKELEVCLDKQFLATLNEKFSSMHEDFMEAFRRNDIYI